MKTIKYSLALITIIVATTLSCDKGFLNTQPLDKISSEATWSDGPLSEAFIFNVYSFLGYGGFEEQSMASYTDEAMFTHAGRNINTFTEGNESPSNLAWKSATYEWGNMFLAIRQANVAISRLPTATFTNTVLRDRLLGEAKFLRAYYYSQLMRNYGGVPLIDKPFGLNEEYALPRNTFAETISFIQKDLDEAITLLDGKGETKGRASKVAALALKSRILLYAASDLHDATKAGAINSALAGTLSAYPAGGQAARYAAAKTAAKAVLDATTGYKLNLSAPVSAKEGQENYNAIAMGGGSGVADVSAASELLLQRSATALYTTESNWPLGGLHYGINNGPNGYHNWAGNTPIQQMVDDYEMMDGSKFDWSKEEHKAAPYANRDPRFYASILYDGANWKPRPSDVIGLDPVSQVQTGYYDDGKGNLLNGIDTRESAIENWNGSRSHYYTRKFIDPNPALPDNQSNAQVVPWPFLRYTEAVLNYVEASIKTGDEAEARAWLNKIRFRAGMPAITDSGTDLWNRYVNERRVELAYEEHRFYDVRRWLIAPSTVGRGIKTINIVAKLKAGKSALVPYRYDKSVYDYTYKVVDNTENETRKWNDKMYYRPFSRDEISRNAKLVQNPLYQ